MPASSLPIPAVRQRFRRQLRRDHEVTADRQRAAAVQDVGEGLRVQGDATQLEHLYSQDPTTFSKVSEYCFAKLSATPLPNVSLSDHTAIFVIFSVSYAKSAMAGPWTVSGAMTTLRSLISIQR